MNAIISNLTAAMLLVHALVGCCRHHDHSQADRDRVAASESLATGCCHGDGCCGREQEQTPPPCNCKLECKALCIYLPPEKCVVDAGDLVLSVDVVPIETAQAAIEAASAIWLCDCKTAHSALEPPLRLHLLHQVILI